MFIVLGHGEIRKKVRKEEMRFSFIRKRRHMRVFIPSKPPNLAHQFFFVPPTTPRHTLPPPLFFFFWIFSFFFFHAFELEKHLSPLSLPTLPSLSRTPLRSHYAQHCCFQWWVLVAMYMAHCRRKRRSRLIQHAHPLSVVCESWVTVQHTQI